ncbi:hypothetical protein AMTR_s00034p00138310 [Amborella trichopoda]|uniref:Elongator complex protein 2 n=1 Tax=Amborella trichopoda TaxID=13333 RepID=W1PWN8_AMBTC|nr:hypothetical protein AMTR_s00034p00138310 [Amborella trichopoda]
MGFNFRLKSVDELNKINHVEVECVFIGAGCNRLVNTVAWGACDLVAFGAQNAVAILCPKSAQIVTTLPGHNAVVNCTEWIPCNYDVSKVWHADEHFLLSGSADASIILWAVLLKERKWRQVLQIEKPHQRGVTCIAGLTLSPSLALFASTSSDCTVCVWEIVLPSTAGGDCKLTCLSNINMSPRPMVALSMAELPGNSGNVVLAMGGLDNKIHIYCGESSRKFSLACELKGHTDWIRGLDISLPVCIGGEESLLLASSSQDRSIRIWKIALHRASANKKENGLGLQSYIEGPIFRSGLIRFQISLESLLIGHEDWVYSVAWQPPLHVSLPENCEWCQPLSLLSASMDKTMMIWRPERTSGLWMNEVTVGELSHSALGFYGGQWGPKGESILAHGYGGSFHLWVNVGGESEDWQPQLVPSGHSAAVTDLRWSKSAKFLLSVSHDQTARIFGPWEREKCLGKRALWHEIARPQVHGHDINCVTIVQGKGNHLFVSGADEKVARVFEAPLSFLKTLHHGLLGSSVCMEDTNEEIQILGANMSALGLSQKPVYIQAANTAVDKSTANGADKLETILDAVPIALTSPPIEEQLAWHTLWPESHKLYGHGNELYSLCCDHGGKLIASACKAQSAHVAEIWLWEVGSWKVMGRLHSHNLTVTQIEFSHDDRFLLAVSRDRHFSVFSIENLGEDRVTHQLLAKHEAHKRIIWACSWNPIGHEFATGSRDKTVKIWGLTKSSSEEAFCVKQVMRLPPFKSSITALSWYTPASNGVGFLAIGMEHGLIELWSVNCPSSALPALRLDPFQCHVATVHRLSWRSLGESEDCHSLELASCGADHTVRVFTVKIA